MALTTPDAIRSPNDGDQYALVQDLGVLADSTQVAVTRRANMYVGTSAQRVAFTTAADGTHWQDTNGSRYEWVRVGGFWRGAEPLGGLATLTPPSAGGNVTSNVSFPSGYFASTPIVVVGAGDGAGETVNLNISALVISNTGFVISLTRTNGTATRVNWIALPPK